MDIIFGSVREASKISDTEGSFEGILKNGDEFGSGVSWIDNLDGDGVPDLAVGAIGDDDIGVIDKNSFNCRFFKWGCMDPINECRWICKKFYQNTFRSVRICRRFRLI